MDAGGLKVEGFVQNSSNIFAENRLLKFGFAAMTIVMLFQSYRIATQDDTIKERLIPIGAQGDLVVSGRVSDVDQYVFVR